MEDIERESIQLVEQLKSNRIDRPEKVLKHKVNKLNIKASAADFCLYIDNFEMEVKSAIYALSVRSLAAQLKGAIPGDHFVVVSRIKLIKEEVNELKNEITTYSETVQSRISDLKGFYIIGQKNKDEEIQKIVWDSINNKLRPLEDKTQQILNNLSEAESGLQLQQEQFSKPMGIEIDVNQNGDITQARKLTGEII